ncbi:hypothetical protein ABPG75_007751 [Micractinium tetrahymenae]
MLRHQLPALRRAAEAALPAAASSLLQSLQQLLALHAPVQQQPGANAAAAAARQYGSAARHQARPATAAGAVGGGGFPSYLAEDEEPEPELRLPEDLSTIAALHPQLREIMLQHQSLQKSAGVVELLMQAVQEAQPEAQRARSLTRTSISRLRVDTLRSLLDRLGGDSRGNKDVLVQRLMDMAGAEERAQLAEQQRQHGEAQAAQLDGGDKGGVVSGKVLAEQRKLAQARAAADSRGGSYGVPEDTLRQAHREMVQAAEYRSIFQPQEIADILAEARADDVLIIDVRGRCPFTDFMVLGTARSQRLAGMMAGAVLHALKARAGEVAPGKKPTIEGAQEDSPWLVVDAGSVLAHVFVEGWRQEYDLEGKWGSQDGGNITRVAPRATLHTLDSLAA